VISSKPDRLDSQIERRNGTNKARFGLDSHYRPYLAQRRIRPRASAYEKFKSVAPGWNGTGTWIFSDRSKSSYSRSGGVTFAIQES